jgi:hypothetical protein
MLDHETTRKIAIEAVGAAMRTADSDATLGRISSGTLTDHERTLLADAASRMAYHSPTVRALPSPARDEAELCWRFCYTRSYLLHLSDLGELGRMTYPPRSAEQLVATCLEALAAVWQERQPPTG